MQPVPESETNGSPAKRRENIVPRLIRPLKAPAQFREEAVEAYLRRGTDASVLRIATPLAKSLFFALASVIGVALAGAILGNIELTSRGRCVLRAQSGARSLVTQISGTVKEVLASSGEEVTRGAALLTIDSARVRAQLLEADRRLAVVDSDLQRLRETENTVVAGRRRLLENRRDLLRRRIASESTSLARLERKVGVYSGLEGKGYVPSLARDEVLEEFEEAQRRTLALQQELTSNEMEMSALNADSETKIVRLQQEMDDTRARRDALAYSLEQTTVRAPISGHLEAMVARPGDVIDTGAVLGKILPEGVPSRVVAFLKERDRAFVAEGSEVRIELDQLPFAEFGTLNGRIERIARDIASQEERKEAFGAVDENDGPSYRVEIVTKEDEQQRKLQPYLRPGILGNVRFSVRSRRIITLILDPLRKWVR